MSLTSEAMVGNKKKSFESLVDLVGAISLSWSATSKLVVMTGGMVNAKSANETLQVTDVVCDSPLSTLVVAKASLTSSRAAIFFQCPGFIIKLHEFSSSAR